MKLPPITAAFLALFALINAQAAITYVDAVEGASGNTFATGGSLSDNSWVTVGTADNSDDWGKRDFANDGTILEGRNEGGGTDVPLTTQLSELADGSYDIWVFFWGNNDASHNWDILAGLDQGSLTKYDEDGVATQGIEASTLPFTNSPMTTEGPRSMRGAKLGQATVSGGSIVDIFIDADGPASGGQERSWYDGVGYELVVPAQDTDGDGLPDAYEQSIIDADGTDAVDGFEDVMGTGAAPAVTDFDGDGADDAEEYAEGTDPLDDDSDNDGLLDGVESDSGTFIAAGDTGTDPLDDDSDGDGLLDGVEDNSGTFIDASQTGTDPNHPDSDGDGLSDGYEVTNGSDPTQDENALGTRILGVEFNRSDAYAAPSQSLFRIVAGSTTQADNATSYTKTVGSRQVTIIQPGGVNFEFRGANGDSSRAIPGGDTSLSFLVADFIASRKGALDIEITNLPAGDYTFRSYHLDTFTGSGLGFAQGATTTTPNTIEARIGGTLQASVQPTALGADGLGTTFIDDSQVPTLGFTFSHDGSSPLVIELRTTETNGSDSFLLLNGFEIFLSDTP